ncbi:FAD binding domain-containing protein [Aspergillus ambiguus]|uniref:FAD binding domain-containing protein n=1 Tax=Aspergillus ambiguus TaxID=176160 RepID=UPI003CCD1842
MTIRTLPMLAPAGTFQTRRTDVLIVGAGPAGCMAAATLLRYDMNFCLIDKRPTRTQTGHASAFQPRTQEILQTMDLLHTLDGKGHRLTETSFWNRANVGNLVRTYVGSEVVHPTPYQYLFNTDQGLTEDTYEAFLASKGQKVHRFMELIDYKYNVDDHQWPLTAYIKNNATGGVEAWLTKYILGTDGARSATRKVTGIQSSSQGGEDVWAVADVYLDTNFPDYRRRCAIRTPQGGCMLIPRKDEGLRIFLQVDEKSKAMLSGAKDQKSHVGLKESGAYKLTQFVQSHINNVMHPYKADITEIVWISQYHVTQRVVQHFHDEYRRVFLLGDACHTHSPKAGQGMNVSICDAYNLTWKLALVLKGLASTDLLHTYEIERLQIAQQLVEFDARFARQFGQTEDVDSQNLRETWEEGHGFTSGCGYKYPPSLLVDPALGTQIDDHAVEPLTPGKRLLPIDLVRHIDGNHYNLVDVMPSNGRFHLFVFAGRQLMSPTLQALGEALNSHRSPLHLFNSLPLSFMERFRHEDIKTDPIPRVNRNYLIDVFVIHTSDHLDIILEDLPAPFSTHWLMRVYKDAGGLGHKSLGVPEESGALAVVRPDGYIGLVTALDRLDQVTAYFDGFMCKRI